MTDPTKRQARVLELRWRDDDYQVTEILDGTADELEGLWEVVARDAAHPPPSRVVSRSPAN